VDTKLAPGLGEFVMPLCTHTDMALKFTNMGHSSLAFRFPKSFRKSVKSQDLINRLGLPADFGGEEGYIQVNASKDFALERLLQARKQMLDSRLMPFWEISNVRSTSYQEWLTPQVSGAPAGARVEFRSDRP
jgi:hypothetical protein